MEFPLINLILMLNPTNGHLVNRENFHGDIKLPEKITSSAIFLAAGATAPCLSQRKRVNRIKNKSWPPQKKHNVVKPLQQLCYHGFPHSLRDGQGFDPAQHARALNRSPQEHVNKFWDWSAITTIKLQSTRGMTSSMNLYIYLSLTIHELVGAVFPDKWHQQQFGND